MLASGDVAVRLLLALLAGSAIGIERQWHQKMAGLRTNALVALGAAGFVVFTTQASPPGQINLQVAAQIVSGIGFLGAGVILREGINVHGLNTAATLWCSAMTGTLAGGGYWESSLIAAGMVVLTNSGLRPVLRRLNDRLLQSSAGEAHYLVEIICGGAEAANVRGLLLHAAQAAGLDLRQIDSTDVPDSARVSVNARLVANGREDAKVEQIIGALALKPFVTSTTWTVERAIPEA